jgi:gas vesicle protein
MSTKDVLLGVVIGAAAGAALGILFAPDKGINTRRKISSKGEEYADDVKQKFNDILDEITSKIDTVKEKASSFAENGKQRANEIVSEVTSATK